MNSNTNMNRTGTAYFKTCPLTLAQDLNDKTPRKFEGHDMVKTNLTARRTDLCFMRDKTNQIPLVPPITLFYSIQRTFYCNIFSTNRNQAQQKDFCQLYSFSKTIFIIP